ncbi:MAG: ribonuclease Z [Chitinophagales bacterium]|nr:ribonuclease Z [Chitinophagales bacterium]MCZ2393729.1 ribonuclease Z [Chitinophagales bacterium]
MSFEVQILGSNSAVAAHGRHPSSQCIKIHHHVFLVDCGEGTQFQLQKFKLKFFKIENIFISHLHGDHYFGLIGLLTTYQLLRRESQITIFGPPQLEEIIRLQLEVSDSKLAFPLKFVSTQVENTEVIFEDEQVQVLSFPVKHRIPCTGFLFKEKVFPRKINSEAVKGLSLNAEHFHLLRKGEDIQISEDSIYQNEQLTLPNVPPRSYAYCTDTLFLPSLIPIIKGVDLLYHESTFLHELEERAKETFHSTAYQAAQIAHEANVGQLIIGHFSSKYSDLSPLLDEAQSLFPNTFIAKEGTIFSVFKRSV